MGIQPSRAASVRVLAHIENPVAPRVHRGGGYAARAGETEEAGSVSPLQQVVCVSPVR